jgi:serine/threonine protein kinase
MQWGWHWRHTEGCSSPCGPYWILGYHRITLTCGESGKIFFLKALFPFLLQEISVLSQCRCPYITDYYGSYLHQTKLWIVMEYMAGGSVADLVCFVFPFSIQHNAWFNADRSEVSVSFYCHLSSIIISYLVDNLVLFWLSFPRQLQAGPPLDEMSIACILRDLLHAIEYLHSEGKIHRDIKGLTHPPISLPGCFVLNTCNYLEQLPTQ